jgi:hypothetical protein
MNQELRLLEFSLLTTGWVQPVLVQRADKIIIDGFHRWRLSQDSKAVKAKYAGKVPCALLDLQPWEAMLLTVRINRAKGSHVAVRMADLVRQVIDQHGIDAKTVAQHIGASKGEVELLYQDSVFKARNLKEAKYSQAWVPRETKIHGPADPTV